jgi:phosphoglycolate phosphatase-like HAD superfamily hydrolase
MDANPAQPLIDFEPTKEFFIGIDSDGCAFDTMEIKHKECFVPNTIRHFGLQPISRYAREAAEFVNLYSKWRGINRFPALTLVLDLLERRLPVREPDVTIPRLQALRDWLDVETKPSNPALEARIQQADGEAREELCRVLTWSKAVNVTIAETVCDIPPFPFVRETLERAAPQADIIVVSATPGEALQREWREHNIARYAAVIAGQEMGTKTEHLRLAARGKYAPGEILMIGDAPGDLEAARANAALFYPVIPGDEAESWRRLHDEALGRFFAGQYAGDYEAALVGDFLAHLPETPPWETGEH